MISKAITTVASALLAAPFLACAPAAAATSTVITGAPATGGNYIPFGSEAGYPEYQQVYASSDFSGVTIDGTVTIDDIELYTYSGTGVPNTGKIKITLSTTSAAVNGLSTDLTKNFGSSKTVILNNKTLPSIDNGVLTIALATPFTYDPADGNLLIDIDEKSPYSGGPSFAFNGASGGAFSRAYSDMTIPVANNSGLVTGFTVAVPEPSTWAMMVVGFAGLGFAGYRGARRSTAAAAV